MKALSQELDLPKNLSKFNFMSKGLEFENKVAKILLEEIEKDWPIEKFSTHLRENFQGRSGLFHEIDIAIRFEFWGHPYLFIFECKDHQRKIEKKVIGSFRQVKDDLNAHAATVVSSNGFQSGAIHFAKHCGIELGMIINYSYTPLIGDPYKIGLKDQEILKYLRSCGLKVQEERVKECFLNFNFSLGNTYRMNKVLPWENAEEQISLDERIDTGVQIFSEASNLLISSRDWFIVLIGKVLTKRIP